MHTVPQLVTATLLLAGHALVGPSSPSTAASGFCSLGGMTTVHWTGAGDGVTWTDPDNWDGQVPDKSAASRNNVYACIDDQVGGLVVMDVSPDVTPEAWVQSIDVAPGTTVRLEAGAKLFVFGDPATRASTVREGAGLELLGATYGGSGRTDLDGHLTWRSLAPPASATLVSAPCMVLAGENEPPPSCDLGHPGLLAVGPTGVVDVDGAGVNLFDRYQLEIAGRLRLSGSGYVAADHGTRLELLAGPGAPGVLDIRNDGGVYEGFTRDYPGNDPALGLAQIRNAGLILKGDGVGTSAVIGAYTAGDGGRIRVVDGTLTLPAGAGQPAVVAGGRSYGAGTCLAFATYACEPVTTPADPAAALFRVPNADRNGAKVRVREGATTSGPNIAPPVTAHADGLRATERRPAVLVLRYDGSATGNRSWRRIQVYRQARPGAAFRKLPACDERGRPPRSSQVACVDRRRLPGSSRNVHDAGEPSGSRDALMVVRTRETSRWVAR